MILPLKKQVGKKQERVNLLHFVSCLRGAWPSRVGLNGVEIAAAQGKVETSLPLHPAVCP